jgi:hypothetical protein
MPALPDILARRAGLAAEILQDTVLEAIDAVYTLDKRVNIPCCNSTSPAGLVEAVTRDPWSKSGKYALGWVYFGVILLVLTTLLRWYNFWNDKIRVAIHKENVEVATKTSSPDSDRSYELSALETDKSTRKFFPRDGPLPAPEEHVKDEESMANSRLLNMCIALCRWVFYRPIPALRLRKQWRPVIFPSIAVILVVFAALAFVILYCFIPQPLYWTSIAFGSPPLAIRAGMLAVAMMPWIVALSMKANFISILTGIGHERLNVLHRWLAYICLLLSLIHTVPFYTTPVWDEGGLVIFKGYFQTQHFYVYGTGMSCGSKHAALAKHK